MKSQELIVGQDYALGMSYTEPPRVYHRVRLLAKHTGPGIGNEPVHRVLELDDATGAPKTYLDGSPREYYVLPRHLRGQWELHVKYFPTMTRLGFV